MPSECEKMSGSTIVDAKNRMHDWGDRADALIANQQQIPQRYKRFCASLVHALPDLASLAFVEPDKPVQVVIETKPEEESTIGNDIDSLTGEVLINYDFSSRLSVVDTFLLEQDGAIALPAAS